MFYSPKEAVKDLSSSKQARDKRGKDSRAPPQRLQILEDRKHWKTHPLPTFTVPLPRTKGQGTKGWSWTNHSDSPVFYLKVKVNSVVSDSL